MLGDASEAEDVVQEAFLRYVAGTPDAVVSPKAYLATIVTRLCLDELKSARVARSAYLGPWLPEPVLTADLAPGPEEQAASLDDVSLAFLVLLERLTPEERAAFVLREAFEYQYDAIAGILHKTNAASRKLVQRARQRVGSSRRRERVSPDAQRRLTERFILAARHGDIDQLEELLAADATSWMDGGELQKAARRPIRGRERVARQMTGLLARIFPDVTFSFEPVNGGVAVLWWQADRLLVVMMASIVDGAITDLHCVMNPAKVAYLRQRVSPPIDQVA
jgi:RNA polymerase sigma-70 factor (ECF subfamily)